MSTPESATYFKFRNLLNLNIEFVLARQTCIVPVTSKSQLRLPLTIDNTFASNQYKIEKKKKKLVVPYWK